MLYTHSLTIPREPTEQKASRKHWGLYKNPYSSQELFSVNFGVPINYVLCVFYITVWEGIWKLWLIDTYITLWGHFHVNLSTFPYFDASTHSTRIINQHPKTDQEWLFTWECLSVLDPFALSHLWLPSYHQKKKEGKKSSMSLIGCP